MTTASATSQVTSPVISNVQATNIAAPAGAPWSVATITTDTVTNPLTGVSANVEQVLFELNSATPGAYGGAIQADYVVGAGGSLSAADQVFYQPDGAFTATYYGSEAANPYFLATGIAPPDAGYAYTQYDYAQGGALTEVVAVEANGKTFVGTSTGAT